MPLHFINIVDYSRRHSTNAPTDPKIRQIAKITCPSNAGAIDTLLRDNNPHPRLQPDYPPKYWELMNVDTAWAHQGGSGRKTGQINRIKDYAESHGGRIKMNTPHHHGTYDVVSDTDDDDY